MNKDVMFSSATDLWETPQSFFDALNEEFGFETDVCALPENAKCARYFTPEDNGLAQTWTGVCWCNPPYGREIGKWVQKAAMSANKNGATVVMLLPARTDTKWFHRYIYGKAEIRFIAGRLKFGGGKHNAPFPSMVVVFGREGQDMRFVCDCCNDLTNIEADRMEIQGDKLMVYSRGAMLEWAWCQYVGKQTCFDLAAFGGAKAE
jgi:phage N-6-adenine-methyltransferase